MYVLTSLPKDDHNITDKAFCNEVSSPLKPHTQVVLGVPLSKQNTDGVTETY